MAMNEYLEDSRCEEEAAHLLPWYVVGRLSASNAGRVARHLERCAICRDDVVHERALRALLKPEPSLEYAPQPGLAKMLSRIGEFEREAVAAPLGTAPPPRVPRRRFDAVHWLAAAALMQSIVLGVVGTSLYRRSPQADRAPRYTTLSSVPVPVAHGSRIRAVFSPDMSLDALNSLLTQNALTIIRGPSDAGAYTLAFSDSGSATERLEATIAALRADTRVMFVEPAVNEAGAGR
jgi:anti-sigma factor RsiW